jgi:ornithine carbamoyltransferase
MTITTTSGPQPRTSQPRTSQPRTSHGETGLFSLAELDASTVHRLVRRSCELYADISAHDRPLRDLTVGVLFTKTSTRTRTAFTVGTTRLGGTVVTYGPGDLQTNTGESLHDTGRVLGLMLDALVARTSGPVAELRELSRAGGLPVVNAMAAEEHPTQGLCDLATMLRHLGALKGLRLLYVGEGNNTAVALAHALVHVAGATVSFVTPPGFGLPAGVLDSARSAAAHTGSSLMEFHSMSELPEQVDIVYTTRWQTTGTAKSDAAWRETFRPFHIDATIMHRWPTAWFMHDLPAQRGEEVSSDVLDGPRSIAWTQARMKLTSAMAVLEWIADPTSECRGREEPR